MDNLHVETIDFSIKNSLYILFDFQVHFCICFCFYSLGWCEMRICNFIEHSAMKMENIFAF